jgi:hypothetical protein
VNNDRLQGLESYQTDSGVPYTRGWLIGSSLNSLDAFGLGGAGSYIPTSYTSTGPRVFGIAGPGKSLWTIFGLTAAERETGLDALRTADSNFDTKLNKRFNYYKRNATEAGGLGETNG